MRLDALLRRRPDGGICIQLEEDNDMIVNELAKATGVEPHVVRYYTRIGLLRPVRHPENGYKLFRPSDVDRLEWIRRAQELGFTLTEIGTFLDWSSDPEARCTSMHECLCRNVERNHARLVDLQALQDRMEAALADWNRDQAGPGYALATDFGAEGAMSMAADAAIADRS